MGRHACGIVDENECYEEQSALCRCTWRFCFEECEAGKRILQGPHAFGTVMIHPILGYTVKGNIWYQGESNAIRHENISRYLPIWLNSWRKEWKQPDMPFYFMQIAPHKGQPAGTWSAAQNMAEGLKNVGMAVVAFDAADSTGYSSARQARGRWAHWFGGACQTIWERMWHTSGPLFKTMKVSGNRAVLSFEYAEDGLMTPEKMLRSRVFWLRGRPAFLSGGGCDKGSRLEVSLQVAEPVAVLRFL